MDLTLPGVLGRVDRHCLSPGSPRRVSFPIGGKNRDLHVYEWWARCFNYEKHDLSPVREAKGFML